MDEDYVYYSDSDNVDSDGEEQNRKEPMKCLLVVAYPLLQVPARPTSTCAICLENFMETVQQRDIYCSSKCGNVFHENCAGHLKSCPLCRSSAPWYLVKKNKKKN